MNNINFGLIIKLKKLIKELTSKLKITLKLY